MALGVYNFHCGTALNLLLHIGSNRGRDDDVGFSLYDGAWNVDLLKNISLVWAENSLGQAYCNFRPHLVQALLKPAQRDRIGFVHNQRRKVCSPILVVWFNICNDLLYVRLVETTFIIFCIYIPNNITVNMMLKRTHLRLILAWSQTKKSTCLHPLGALIDLCGVLSI